MSNASRYELLEKLGQGSFGSVVKARDKNDGRLYAIKLIPIEKENVENMLAEFKVMEGLAHENIVNQHDMFKEDDYLWLVLEYCSAGSVSDIMRMVKRSFSETEIAAIAKQALEGIAFMHKNKRLHRDIKAGNILLTDNGICKLADFGVAAKLSDTTFKRNTLTGTPYWMAPEVIVETGYDGRADVWSIGITCIEMADGKPPFHSVRPMLAMIMIPNKPPPTLNQERGWSPEFNDFVNKCLMKDPNERPTSEEMLNHPFLKKAGTLKPLAEDSMIRIAEGGLDEESDEEEEEIDYNATHRGSRTNDGTVRYNDDTVRGPSTTSSSVASSISSKFDSMAIKDDSQRGYIQLCMVSGTMLEQDITDKELTFCRHSEGSEPIPFSVSMTPKVVSRLHCQISWHDGKYYIQDLGSSAGTFLNDKRLSDPKVRSAKTLLNPGDLIRLGTSVDPETGINIEGDDTALPLDVRAPKFQVFFDGPVLILRTITNITSHSQLNVGTYS